MLPFLWIFTNCLLSGLVVHSQNVKIPFPNSHVSGGSRQAGRYSLDSCGAACAQTQGCLALDYDAKDASCWFHGAATACNGVIPMGGTLHVKNVNCLNSAGPIGGSALSVSSQSNVLTTFPAQHMLGGQFVIGVKDLPSCLAACSGPGCFAVDFDSADYTCWVHNSPNACGGHLSFKALSTHYRMTTCNSPSPVIPALPPAPAPLANNINALKSSGGLSPAITCGRPSVSPIGGRIVGGDTAVPHSWPWQVALRNAKSKSVRCAGTVIAPFFILTTAHCVDEDTNPRNWMIYTGAHDLLRFEPSRTMFTVSQVILHEGFDVNTFDNDIALLRLTRPITWSRAAAPVCLPPQGSELPPGTQCKITGWGVSENGNRPLRQAEVPIIAPGVCRRPDWLGSEFTITDRMICAGYAFGGTDTCQGDSGGPMVCFLNNRWVQAGLTSFGRGCGLPKKPGVYTKVSRYINWIQRWTTL